jgi:hypothetical protein
MHGAKPKPNLVSFPVTVHIIRYNNCIVNGTYPMEINLLVETMETLITAI